MTKIFTSERFKGLRDRDSSAVFSDIDFNCCQFDESYVSMTLDSAKRSTLQRIKLIQCAQTNCGLGPAILEDILIDGLKTGQLLIANACAYKHVILQGRIGEIKLSRWIPWVSGPRGMLASRQEAMDQANAEYYKGVDWALDISNAEFASGEVEGIPPELIRRDHATQVIVRGAAIAAGRWRELDLTGTYWSALLDAYAKKKTGDVVLVAPKDAPNFTPLLNGLIKLREFGVAEPD